jgi:manganese oxidase
MSTSFKILQQIQKINNLLQQNEIDLAENIALKRQIIGNLESKKIDINITTEQYDNLINEIVQLLEESNINESYLLKKLVPYFGLINESSALDLCVLILNEIGNELIRVGDIDNLGDSADTNNPTHANDSALFGSNDVHQNISTKDDNPTSPRLFNIPTDKERSPSVFTVDGITYDVSTPFTQQLLRFEEMGRISIDKSKNQNKFNGNNLNIPLPETDGYPNQIHFYQFMNNVSDSIENSELGFNPTKQSNTQNPNPWANQIKNEINPPDFIEGVAEGRPPGKYGEHQKWTDDYIPKIMSITCQTGAVANNGCRDSVQMHQYQHGEFGPGGLYHKAVNSMAQGGTTAGITPKFHFNLPEQKKESLWTFDGTFPPKLLMTKYNEPHILRHYNFLPIKPENNRGFGLHTISTHEHNGTNNSISDGFAQTFFYPGEYYDYLFGMTLAGYTSINTDATDPKASAPNEWETDQNNQIIKDDNNNPIPAKNIQIKGNWKETMSTHWFHDHMLDFTAQNVYKGNAAMMNMYSALDRGNEQINDGVNLRLPSGTSLSWGNRDYDVNLAILDKAWDNEGQLWFNPFNTNGFLGDRMLVNWLLEPFFEVRARKYRFRILNASVSRFMKFALVKKYNDSTTGSITGPLNSNTSYDPIPFWLIANCGNLMMHAIKFDGTNGTSKGILPVQAIAERFDIIIDFGQFQEGDNLYFVNVLEHLNGKRPNKEIHLHEILSGNYNGDPCVMKFMEFRVKNYEGTDYSLDPAIYEVGKKQLIPIEPIKEIEIRNAVQRNFNFVNKAGTTDEWAIETDGGKDYKMDPRRLSAAPKTNALELWTLRNGAPTWAHNVHIHFVEGKILLRDDQLPPIWEQFARKDVYRIGGSVDSSESLVIALKFTDSTADSYMMHCHNTQHEDHAMLLRYDINNESCVKTLPCPLPTWQGVKFMETKTLPSFRTGMLEDNMFFVKPEKLLYKLKQIDKVVPDLDTGSYFVNGLGKSLQLFND